MSTPQTLTEFEPDAIAAALEEFGAHGFHARQIYQWIYKRGITDFSEMTDLSQNLRTELAARFTILIGKTCHLRLVAPCNAHSA